MSNLNVSLTDKEAVAILFAKGCIKRKKPSHTFEHRSKICQQAKEVLKRWTVEGVTDIEFRNLRTVPSIRSKLFVKPLVERGETASVVHQANAENLHASVSNQDVMLPEHNLVPHTSKQVSQAYVTVETALHKTSDVEWLDKEPIDNVEKSTTAGRMISSSKSLSFQTILQHFAVVTGQKHSHMTVLLKLLKHHKPDPLYDQLPSTGEKLLKITERDCINEADAQTPIVLNVEGGKYFHYGIENAVNGLSPGVLHFQKDIFQFIHIHQQDPTILPFLLRKKIDAFDEQLQVIIAKKKLKGESVTELLTKPTEQLPHFVIDISIDGVQFCKNSKIPSGTPILGRMYSIKKSATSTEQPILFARPQPFIIGLLHATKSNDCSFLSSLITELQKLCPQNEDDIVTAGRTCTVSLRCVIADGPMRSFLKRTKGHQGRWSCDRCIQPGAIINRVLELRDVHAPRRIDFDFLRYCVSEDSVDEHIPNPLDLSPFCQVNIGMVSGFVIDTMHSMFAGAFLRRLHGFQGKTKRNEGKLSARQLAIINSRLERYKKCLLLEFDAFLEPFGSSKSPKCHVLRDCLYYHLHPLFRDVLQPDDLNHVMLLQYAMLLLGGFSTDKVPEEHIQTASNVLKTYSEELVRKGIPCRFTSHQIIHLPEDVTKFGCGIESLSAFQFENFYAFFRQNFRSGNLMPEQIRNRLIERSKYLLPTTADGSIITNYSALLSDSRINSPDQTKNVLHEFVSGTEKRATKLVFFNFTLTNKFPNNFVLLTNLNPVVITDIIEYPPGKGTYRIIGHKFTKFTDAFTEPFTSSLFNIYEARKLRKTVCEWDISKIKCKMYPFPLVDSVALDVFNEQQSWYIAPLRHTVI